MPKKPTKKTTTAKKSAGAKEAAEISAAELAEVAGAGPIARFIKRKTGLPHINPFPHMIPGRRGGYSGPGAARPAGGSTLTETHPHPNAQYGGLPNNPNANVGAPRPRPPGGQGQGYSRYGGG